MSVWRAEACVGGSGHAVVIIAVGNPATESDDTCGLVSEYTALNTVKNGCPGGRLFGGCGLPTGRALFVQTVVGVVLVWQHTKCLLSVNC